MTQSDSFEPLRFEHLSPDEQRARSALFLAKMRTQHMIAQFSPEPVPFELITNAILTAGLAPSMAGQQPWHFVVVSSSAVKRRIREAAEIEEKKNFEYRMDAEWRETIAPDGHNWHKPHLEAAPYLIVVFAETYRVRFDVETGREVRMRHYFVTEAVGFAVGLLLCSLHHAGLVCVLDTPSPMGFLSEILRRPSNERPYVIIPTGYPAPHAQAPKIPLKTLDELMTHIDEGTEP